MYVALFVIGLSLVLHGHPAGDAAPAKVIAYYRGHAHRMRIDIGWLLLLIGVFFFTWFVAALRESVRRLVGDGLLATVTLIGGTAYAALTLVSASVGTAIFTMSDDTYQHQVYPELIHAANDALYVLHSAGGAAIGAMIVAASLAARAARAIPAWLGWLSVLAGIVAIFSIFFIPWLVVAVWIVVASVLVWRSLGPTAAASSPLP